jgi:sortase (surface protein transpeptidase)
MFASLTGTRLVRSLLVGAAATVAVVGLAGCSGAAGGTAARSSAPSTSTSASPRPGAAAGLQNPDATSFSYTPGQGDYPTHIAISAIGVSSGLESLAIGAQGELDPPGAAMNAGWYAKGVVPGGVGPAIIAGHIDSATGPGVFLHLNRLVPGDTVTITMKSGVVETWKVVSSDQSPKSNFPTSSVYGTTPTPALRLITCQGVFNPKIGHYDDNLIVFADLVSVKR